MASYDNENGVWRTIGGRRVFIREGQSLADAMKASGKFGKRETDIKSHIVEEIDKDTKNIKITQGYIDRARNPKTRNDFREDRDRIKREKAEKEDLLNYYDNPKESKADISNLEGKHIEGQKQEDKYATDPEFAKSRHIGFSQFNKDGIPVYDGKIDNKGDFGWADLSTLSDEELRTALNVQSEEYYKATNEALGDQRTRNGKMDKIFNTAKVQKYEEGMQKLNEEIDKRDLPRYNIYDDNGMIRVSSPTKEMAEKQLSEMKETDKSLQKEYGWKELPKYSIKEGKVDEYLNERKENIKIENKNGELTGYTDGERIEYSHSGSTGLMANVYSTDDGKLSGQYFEIPKEYQGDKLKDYSLKEIERLKSDKEAYETRQKEGLDKFISKSTNPFYPDREYSKEDMKKMEDNGVKPMDNTYSGSGWKGVNADKNLSTKEQAKAVTDEMKKQFPDVRISRKSDVYSGGSSIDFNIMSSDKDMYISDKDIDKLGSEQLFNTDITRGYGFDRWAENNVANYKTEHSYSVDDVKKYAKETLNNIRNHEEQNVRGNEWYLSDYGKKVVSELNKQANSYTYDDSDAMTDYFNHGTYMNISIGKYNKPYEVNQPKATNQINASLQRKGYQKYMKEHPGSKMTFDEYKNSKK